MEEETKKTNGLSLEEIVKPIRKELEEFRSLFDNVLLPKGKHLKPLLSHLARYRGKELRPTLLLLSAGCCGSIQKDHFRMAAAVELIHTASLIHDDILDEAGIRRRVDTLHRKWGMESSILLGDFLLSKAFFIAFFFKNRESQRILMQAAMDICQGEIHQTLNGFNYDLSEREYLTIIREKTASFFAACCRLGALHPNPEETRKSLERFGLNLGIAFQMVDDAIDVLGDEKKAGKTLGSDLKKGKLTLPIIHFLKKRGEEGRRQLKKAIESQRDGWQNRIRKVVSETGGFQYTKQRIHAYLEKGLRALRTVEDSPYRTSLQHLARFVETRFPF